MTIPRLDIPLIDSDFSVALLDAEEWRKGDAAHIDRYWSGTRATEDRHCEVRMVWSISALYGRFECVQREPVVAAALPRTVEKTIGLWERDVCEIFVAPDAAEPRRYFEFEAAPTGEWLDVALDLTGGTRRADWDYASGLEVFAEIGTEKVVTAMRIPFTAFGRKPEGGDVWRGNLFRCVGQSAERGYLAWSPTMTPEPNFHVPERFGEFHFVS